MTKPKCLQPGVYVKEAGDYFMEPTPAPSTEATWSPDMQVDLNNLYGLRFPITWPPVGMRPYVESVTVSQEDLNKSFQVTSDSYSIRGIHMSDLYDFDSRFSDFIWEHELRECKHPFRLWRARVEERLREEDISDEHDPRFVVVVSFGSGLKYRTVGTPAKGFPTRMEALQWMEGQANGFLSRPHWERVPLKDRLRARNVFKELEKEEEKEKTIEEALNEALIEEINTGVK